jgi:hypothetical protein
MSALSKVPGIAWVILLTVALSFVGGLSLYLAGLRHERQQLHRVALSDSTTRATAAVHTAVQKSDSTVRVARTAAAISDVGRAALPALRVAAAAALDTAPLPLVRLVDAQAGQIARDSVTIAVQAATIDTLLAERAPREQLDTLRQHAVQLEADAGGGVSRRTVAAVVVIAAAVLTLLHR